MSVLYKNTLIKIDELPKINGESIKAIFPMKYYEKYNRVQSCYKGDVADYYYCSNYFHNGRDLRIKELPKEFKELMGDDSYISYRVRGSGNGSFIDDSIYISVIDSQNFSVTRGDNNTEFSEIGVKLLNTLNKEYICEEVGEYEFIKTDSVPFRIEGGFSYPDKSCIGWRKPTEFPYVSNEVGSVDNIRVFDEDINAHVYLQKVSELKKGDTDLVRVIFTSDKPHLFCNILKWTFNPNDYIRFNIEVKHRDNTYGAIAMNNTERRFKQTVYNGQMYRVINIMKKV